MSAGNNHKHFGPVQWISVGALTVFFALVIAVSNEPVDISPKANIGEMQDGWRKPSEEEVSPEIILPPPDTTQLEAMSEQ